MHCASIYAAPCATEPRTDCVSRDPAVAVPSPEQVPVTARVDGDRPAPQGSIAGRPRHRVQP